MLSEARLNYFSRIECQNNRISSKFTQHKNEKFFLIDNMNSCGHHDIYELRLIYRCVLQLSMVIVCLQVMARGYFVCRITF